MRGALLALLVLGCTKPAPQPQPQPRAEAQLLPGPISVATPAPDREVEITNLSGIWQGNVGTQPVRACFVERDRGAFGDYYYYLSRLSVIGLQAVDGAPASYQENARQGAPVWRDVRATATTLTARWTNGSQTLPVQLRRLADAAAGGEDGPCASIAFHGPRLVGIRTVRTRATVDGTAYTKLVLDNRGRFDINVETFALDGRSPAIRRINTALDGGFAGNPPGWFGCVSGSLGRYSFGREGGSSETSRPAMISRRWLSVIAQGEVSCGGVHPDNYHYYQVFDLTTGAEVELLDWFLRTAVKREHVAQSEDSRTPEPEFRDFLLAHWRPGTGDAECRAFIRDNATWHVGLTRTGFVFTPEVPHVMQACEDDIPIPFDQLRRWLNPAGATAVAALRAEPRWRRRARALALNPRSPTRRGGAGPGPGPRVGRA